MELSLEEIEAVARAAYEKGRLSAFPEVVKSWDESQHPRGDDGRFINKDEISAAAKSPAKAAQLRKQVTNPTERAKLEHVLDEEQKDNREATVRTGKHGISSEGFGKGLHGASPTREPHATATMGEHPDGERPGVGETVELARGLRSGVLDQANRGQLAERLALHSGEELKEIKRQLGLRASGRKAELASKILMAASGHDYPEQGFTGALPVRGQGIHHYEDGVLQHIERDPSPGVHASRVTPEEAHAVIDYHIGQGTLLKQQTRQELAGMLMNRMSYRDIADLKQRLGLKASGRKQIFADKILYLVEGKHREALTDPAADWNRPDPVGKMGSLAERKQHFETMHALYGNGVHPERQDAVDDAGSRLQLAIQSPFASFNRDGAVGEAKAAINDLYNQSEMLAAAAKAGLKLDPKDGKVAQQIAAVVARMAGNDDNPANDEAVIGAGAAQHITPAHHTHRVTGNTFKHKDDIVKAGGVWNSLKKQWTVDEGAKDFLHPELGIQPLEEAKAAGGFQRAKPESHTHRLIGDTYKNRDAIKKAGGAWDAVGKYWTIDADGAKVLPQGVQAQPIEHRMFADTEKLTEADAVSKKDAGLRKIAENIHNAHQQDLAKPNLIGKPAADEFLERAGKGRSPIGQTPEEENAIAGHLRGLMDRHTASAPGTGKPAIEQPKAVMTNGEAVFEDGRHRFSVLRDAGHKTVPVSVAKEHAEEFKAKFGSSESPEGFAPHPSHASNPGQYETVNADTAKLNDSWSKDEGFYIPTGGGGAEIPGRREKFSKFANAEPDPTPGRTEHLQAVASGAGHDELRDAADTVSRIEDIPQGERTADDRAELKRAKELAAANTAEPVSKPTAEPQIVEPTPATGDPWSDHVPTAKRVESDAAKESKKKQADAALEDAFGMKTVATREREESAAPQSEPTPDDHEKTIRDIKPGESAEIAGHVVRRGKLNDEVVSIDLPEGGVRTDTVAGAAKYLAGKGIRISIPKPPSQKLGSSNKDPDAPDTATSHGKASAVPIGVTNKEDFESRGRGTRKSLAVESPVYDLPS